MATFNVSNSNGRFSLRLTVKETATSAAKNTSTLSYNLQLIANTSYHFSDYRIGYTVSLNGNAVEGVARADASQQSIASNGTLTLCSGTCTVTHDDDGALNMPVEFAIDMASEDYTPGPLSGSGTMTLTTLARGSTVGATAANIGEVSTITVTRMSNSYTHSIAFSFGSLSGYITADGGTAEFETKITATSIPFTVPASFYAQIPNAKKGTCTLTIKTYAGSTQIGSAQTAKFTATAARSACAPSVTATAADINDVVIAITQDDQTVIKGVSDVQVISEATAKNSASITSIVVVCGSDTMTGKDVTFWRAKSGTITVKATDSRGYSTSVVVSLALVEYFSPTLAVSAKRTDQTSGSVQLTAQGAWFDGALGATLNTPEISISCAKYGSQTAIWSVEFNSDYLATNGGSYSYATELTGLDYKTAYIFTVKISDKVCCSGGAEDPVVFRLELPRGIPIAHWGANDFWFEVPVHLPTGDAASIDDVNAAIAAAVKEACVATFA